MAGGNSCRGGLRTTLTRCLGIPCIDLFAGNALPLLATLRTLHVANRMVAAPCDFITAARDV